MTIDTPSLAIGILRGCVAAMSPRVDVTEYPGSLRWAEYLLDATGGEITPAEYMRIADHGLGYGVGDWIFAGGLYGNPAWRSGAMRRHAAQLGKLLPVAERMRQFAGGFVEAAADEILRADPDVVAFSTTFMQSVSSLAVARRIKHLRPRVVVVFGGANCEGPMGHAVHRNHRFVDFVVRGEGELAFPAVLEHIAQGTAPSAVPGVCWWHEGRSMANPNTTAPVPPAVIPMPEYDDWFAALENSPVREYVAPYLFVEGSRGCWWGERHHCTFCGLNGAMIGFRGKPADQFWRELTTLITRHRVLNVMTADNIINQQYYRDLLPRIVESGWDLRLQFEAKANVQDEKIALLAEAGVCAVQFGIESLNSGTLKIMDKGVTATTNIRVLRQSEAHAVTVLWNYLYGFPGERAADYWPVIEQMDALVHLQPPAGASRILLERFSPYFERPELGFARRRPLSFYYDVYDLPDAEVHDLAYYFDSDDAGIDGEVEAALRQAIADWRQRYPGSSLFVAETTADSMTLCDRREGWPERDHRFVGWQRVAYDALRRGHRPAALHRRLAEQGHEVPLDVLRHWLADCQRDGLVFSDADDYVALATDDVSVHLVAEDREVVYA